MNVETDASDQSRRELLQVVKRFLVENFYVSDPEGLPDDESLVTSGIVDSTGMLEVIAFLEGRLGITVRDHEMVPENLETVARIVDFVTSKRANPDGHRPSASRTTT